MMQPRRHIKKTRQSTDIFFEADINKSVSKAKSEVREILLSLKNRDAKIMYGGQIATAAPCDFPRLLVEWSKSSSLDRSIRNIIVSAILSAEEKLQGSGFLAAGLWVIKNNEQIKISKIKRCTFEEAINCIDYFGNKGFSSACAISLINLGGLGHSIEYLEHSEKSCLIDVMDGNEILGKVDLLFGDKIGYSHSFDKCSIVAVDGIIETVGSIHGILLSSQKSNVVLMAKKFLPDVANTMAESWKSGRANCLPICVEDWSVDNFLDLEKMKISCVSIERGDILSSVKIENSEFLKFDTNGNKTFVEFSGNKKRSKIFVKISKSLGGMVGPALDRTKMLLGYSRLASRSGVINWSELCELSSDFSDLYSKNLAVPCNTLEGAFRVHKSLQEILHGMGCLITV